MTALLDEHAATIPHLLVLRECDTELRFLGRSSRLWRTFGYSYRRVLAAALGTILQADCGRHVDDLRRHRAASFSDRGGRGHQVDSPGPIFFTQQRVGRDGKMFRMWKFRSMVVNAEQVLAAYLEEHPDQRLLWQKISKLKRDPRVTRIGKFLRRTSLDELPQLWNVLRGEMSLVGPRPLPLYDVPKHGSAYAMYTRMRPGMTGLWQVSGRSNTTYEQHIRLDLQYIRNWSPWFDLCILAHDQSGHARRRRLLVRSDSSVFARWK